MEDKENGVPILLKLTSAQALASLNSNLHILGIGTAQALGIFPTSACLHVTLARGHKCSVLMGRPLKF